MCKDVQWVVSGLEQCVRAVKGCKMVCNWCKSSLEQWARGLNIVCNNPQVCARGGKGFKNSLQGCARRITVV